MALPHRQASMGSMGANAQKAAMRSMARELTAMENREDSSRWAPISLHPAKNRGMLMTMVKRPTESWGTSALMTWAMPVTPPMAT